jgi:hypothetical protein
MDELVRRVNCNKPEFDTGPGLVTEMARRYLSGATMPSAPSNLSLAGGRVHVFNHSVWSPIDWSSRLWTSSNLTEKDRIVEQIVASHENGGGRHATGLDGEARTGSLRAHVKSASRANLGDGAFALTFWAHTWRHR